MEIFITFLYGFLNKKMNIMQLTIFEVGTIRVFLLKKDLYSLKQSPRVWWPSLLDFLWKLDFNKTKPDYSLWVSAVKLMLIIVYVDDLFLFRADIDCHINNVM